MIPHDFNNIATKGNVCWGPRTEFLKPKCSTGPDLCQHTSARNIEPESVDPPPPETGGGGTGGRGKTGEKEGENLERMGVRNNASRRRDSVAHCLL